jgi:hypothetical protein
MSFLHANSHPQTIEAVAEEVEAAAMPRSKNTINREIARFGARLSELLAQETPHDLLGRLGEFRRSVADALTRSSSTYQLLRQLEDSGLKDCARCTHELEARLACNPHYVVLRKLDEAEKAVAKLTAARL